jgi:hypothetical protein
LERCDNSNLELHPGNFLTRDFGVDIFLNRPFGLRTGETKIYRR